MATATETGNEQLRLGFESPQQIYRVGELNAAVQRSFEARFRNIFVAGEISGCRLASSGHHYFSLKDEASQLKCALFKGTSRFLRFRPQDGLAVIARGSLEVYEARGEYQFIVEHLDPQGAGALQLAYEQLKKKLADEGLFEPGRKRPLPKFPQRIGVITSPSGAVIRDILNILERRFKGLHVRLLPAQVQGEGSVERVCSALRLFNETQWPDVIVLARGGGSLEDLWTFNEESVARAIAESAIPVITAIGHETDFTIADFVADHRAPTPSAAAEIVICTRESLLERIAAAQTKALQASRYRILSAQRDLHLRGADRAGTLIHRRLSNGALRVDELDERLRSSQTGRVRKLGVVLDRLQSRLTAADLRLRFSRLRHTNDLLWQRLGKAMELTILKTRTRQTSAASHLRQLSPTNVLSRGYAIVRVPDGRVVRSSVDVGAGDKVNILLGSGQLGAVVTEKSEPAA